VLYTDGVIEEPRGADAGPRRLARVLSECRGADAATIADAVARSAVEAGGESPRDDVAVLVLRVNPSSG